MSQFFPNNGENSQLIPKWESKKVSCEIEQVFVVFHITTYLKTVKDLKKYTYLITTLAGD